MIKSVIKSVLLTVLMAIFIAGCSGKPAQAPEAFIMEFMPKHITMVDATVSDYYISTEAATVKNQVSATIAELKKENTLDAFTSAKLDLSHLDVKVVEKKNAVYDDQEYTFIKISVTGKYSIDLNGVSKEVIEDETFVIKVEGKGWKVTETENPWS